MLRKIIKKIVPGGVRRLVRRLLGHRAGAGIVSSHYEILPGPPVAAAPTDAGWEHPAVAVVQENNFKPLLAALQMGTPRADFTALAQAVRAAGLSRPEIVELGCGSGWNFRVLDLLYGQPFTYTGLDCSAAMLDIARREFPAATFIRGDAVATPFPDGICDLLISGTVLMHLADYRGAIREARRLARRYCVFHTVPITSGRPTTFLRKLAYGQPTVEVIFNEAELLACFLEAGLTLRETFESLNYNLEAILGEPTRTRTYLCAIIP